MTIPFFAQQQVGNFVYHCHILSHEDSGMMAVLEVYDPTQSAANRTPVQRAAFPHNAICGSPPMRQAASSIGQVLGAAWSTARSSVGTTVDGPVSPVAARR